MRLDSSGPAYVAESVADFDGWEILDIVDHKPGVKRVYVRKIFPGGGGEFRIVYSDEKITERLLINA